jgi:hypothetical protein
MRRLVLWLAFAAALWVLATGAYGAWTWPEAKARVTQALDDGMRDCRTRYAEKPRQDRCIDLFRLIFESDRNTAIFTRVLGALVPPALGFGGLAVWSVMRRRREPSPARTRR